VNLSSAANVVTPAYLVLLAKGYEVSLSGPLQQWIATKGEDTFVGDSTIELLGLISIAETRGNDWRASDDEIMAFLQLYKLIDP
jgi:hypothetical protein